MTNARGKRAAALIARGVAVVALAIAAIFYSQDTNDSEPAIRFAYQNRIGSAACVVAVENDFFTDEELKIEPFRFNSGPACAEALYSGSADIGTMGDTTAIITISRDDRFVIIASHGQGEHRHRLMVDRNSRITMVEDLRGKTVGVKKGTSTYGGFLLLLASRQLDPAEIRILDMRPSEMPDALAASSIDAFIASEPTPSLAQVRGARELATMGGLGNTYPILILARRELLRARPDQVARFLRAMQRAEEAIQAAPHETAAILTRITGLPPEVAYSAMTKHRYALSLDTAIIESLHQTATFLRDQGIIASAPNFEDAIDTHPLKASPHHAPSQEE